MMKNIEILSILGTNPEDLHLLLHVNEDPDDWETFSTAVVHLTPSGASLAYQAGTWVQSMALDQQGKLYLASVDSEIHTNCSGRWQVLPLGQRHSFNRITCLADGSLVCCGSRAGVFRGHGMVWRAFNEGLPESADLLAIDGSSIDDLYALGKKGAIFQREGESWVGLASPTNRMLVGTYIASPGDAYFCGWKGSFFRKGKDAWQQYAAPEDVNFQRIVLHDGVLNISAGRDGIFRLAGQVLEPWSGGRPASSLASIGGILFAAYDDQVYALRDGQWGQVAPDLHDLLS